MKSPDQTFAQQVVDSTELLVCAECGVPTAHRHEQVLVVLPGATMSEVEMSCMVCDSRRIWLDIQPTRN